MYTYLILQHPGHNRVYYNLAGQMALSELKLAANRLSVEVEEVCIREIAGVRYLSVTVKDEPKEEDWQLLSRLSFVFALFRVEGDGNDCRLLPMAQSNYEYVDSKISSLLKYPGKTNELFTKMMVNVALLSSQFDCSETINLLDPVAGRGTTLFEALVYGYNASGIEIEHKSVHESNIFFKKYVEAERYKHKVDKRQIAGKSKLEAVHIQEFDFAPNKEMFKDETQRRHLGIVNGNSVDTGSYFKANSFHLLVGDLPYGIAHGNSGAHKSQSITRNPSELLKACLPGWKKVLKKGGALVLAWNSFVVSRYQLSKIMEEHGMEVLSEAPYDGFEHMVDKSIKRDIIVARKG